MKIILPKAAALLFTSCYTAFVLKYFWHWFVVPTLYARDISFLQMLGLLWMVKLLTDRRSIFDDSRWKEMAATVNFCVPEKAKNDLKQSLQLISMRRWVSESDTGAGGAIDLVIRERWGYYLESLRDTCAEIGADTVVLAAGFALHLLSSRAIL